MRDTEWQNEKDVMKEKSRQRSGRKGVLYCEHFLVQGWAWLPSYALNMKARFTL
jgi:hypothetical protein